MNLGTVYYRGRDGKLYKTSGFEVIYPASRRILVRRVPRETYANPSAPDYFEIDARANPDHGIHYVSVRPTELVDLTAKLQALIATDEFQALLFKDTVYTHVET